MFKRALKKAIEKYIAATSPREASRAIAHIAKVVDRSTESNALEQIQEVLAEFDDLPECIKNRFTPGSSYKEGRSLVFGWYRENQVQAELLPVTDVCNGLQREGYLRVTANRDGFEVPVDMPLAGGACVVSVPYEQSFYYAKYGWANACPIQWDWDEEGYKVDRSILPYGFGKAWKWWEGACSWYMKNRPELFEDFDCWGKSWRDLEELDASKPKPGDAVLGGSNKEFWKKSEFYLE